MVAVADAVVVRHEVAVSTRREAATEALEVGVVRHRGHVQHLHHGEGCEVEAHHIAVVADAVVVRHQVAVVARREAAVEALEGGVGVRHVQHIKAQSFITKRVLFNFYKLTMRIWC